MFLTEINDPCLHDIALTTGDGDLWKMNIHLAINIKPLPAYGTVHRFTGDSQGINIHDYLMYSRYVL